MSTIFALASARGKAGISVIRLSGPAAHRAVSELAGGLPPLRVASLRKLHWKGDLLDEALVLIFQEKASFTGEQSAELHLHGSIAVVSSVLRVLGDMEGLRPANAGEFTWRALENGCLDLTQVEGLADLIDAETEAQRKQAQQIFSGALARKVDQWRQDLIRAAALIEATIDFADEEVPVNVAPEVISLLDRLLNSLNSELAGAAAAERIRSGFTVAIVGAPNAGKSTLLNALAGREAAITSEIAGTTRDVIEVHMDLGGLSVTLLDTAGLRYTDDVVERIGVSRAIERATLADLRVFLLATPEDRLLVDRKDGDIVVLAKGDLLGGAAGTVSGRTGQGIDDLVAAITGTLSQRAAGAGLLIRERQRIALINAVEAVSVARSLLMAPDPVAEFVAAELRAARRALEFLVGKIDVESLLGEIFSSFCIGK